MIYDDDFYKKLRSNTIQKTLCDEDVRDINMSHQYFRTSKYFDVYTRHPKR
jgi:hypothetical protein